MMQTKQIRSILLAAFVCVLAAGAATAQDFQKEYPLGQGGSINIRNISGDVIVRGYDGQMVIVQGFKEGRDKDRVNIEDQSTAGAVSVRAQYPERGERDREGGGRNWNIEASVRFEVKVPRAVNYRFDSFSSVSGNVEVSDVSGELRAKSVSGEVTVKGVRGSVNATSVSGEVKVGEVRGTVNAKSTSGDVEVGITDLSGADSMDFASVSGNVRVKLPASLDATVKMSTMSGDLKTDFPLTVEELKYGTGRRANGRVGGGAHSLKLSSVSGSVSLLRM